MEEYDRDNYQTKRRARPGPRGTSQQVPSSVFGDDFGDGFSGGIKKVKTRSTIHRGVPYVNTSRAPPVIASSRPRYKRDTAMIISSAEDNDSADEMNLCGSQSEYRSRSRRAGTSSHQPLSNSLEQRRPTSRDPDVLQSPARGARALGKQREIKVAKVVPSPLKEDPPLNTLVKRVPDRTVSSSRMSLRRSRSPLPDQRPSRAVVHPVAPTSPSKVPLRQKLSSSDLCPPATLGDHLSDTKSVRLKESSLTRKQKSLLLLPARTGPLKKEEDLRSLSEKRNTKPLATSQKGRENTVSSISTNFSSTARGSGSSKASTRSGRKRFESDGESTSYQREEVPWADTMNLPSSPASTTPKPRRIESSKSSQIPSIFPMQLTPPELRMKKQATLDKPDKLVSSPPGNGGGRSPKRKRSSMKEVSDFSDECVIASES